MNPPSEDIKDMLEAESSLALTFATDLFIGVEPDPPDNCVTIFDSPGFPPELSLTQKDDADYFKPSVQIRVRNNAYLVGWSVIDAIKLVLHARSQETWGGALYTMIVCAIEPALLDWDENGRARFVTTFNLQRR